MRETKTVKIDGLDRPVRVNELTLREVMGILQSFDPTSQTIGELRLVFLEKLLPLVSDIKEAELMSLAPSRIARLWEAVKEVNGTFFACADLLGARDVLQALRSQFIGVFSRLLASSSKPGTSASGTTDSPTT